MNMDIEKWTEHFLNILEETFGSRVWFAGLQGSRGRGEATETSDIDMVVILDRLTPEDISAYNRMIDTMPDRELICGFLSGRDELMKWEPSDLIQFYYDTRPLKGSLDELLERIDSGAAERAVRTGVCNIYHMCVHNMLYDRQEEILRGLYKSAVFVMQTDYFRKTGKYVKYRKELLELAEKDDREILETYTELKSEGRIEFGEMSEKLFLWVQTRIVEM